MVTLGPDVAVARGCAASTTSAVIALATDPIGRTTAGLALARVPLRLVASAKLPRAGTGIDGGAVPSTSRVAGTLMLTSAGGDGATSFAVTNVPAAISSAPITATNTIHTHEMPRARAIRRVDARLPVACLGAYQRR